MGGDHVFYSEHEPPNVEAFVPVHGRDRVVLPRGGCLIIVTGELVKGRCSLIDSQFCEGVVSPSAQLSKDLLSDPPTTPYSVFTAPSKYRPLSGPSFAGLGTDERTPEAGSTDEFSPEAVEELLVRRTDMVWIEQVWAMRQAKACGK